MADTDKKKTCCVPSRNLMTSWQVRLKPKNNMRLQVLTNNHKEEISKNNNSQMDGHFLPFRDYI